MYEVGRLMLYRAMIGLFIALALTISGYAANYFYRAWSQQLEIMPVCEDRSGIHRADVTEQLRSYYDCVDVRARLFLERDYAETKDLAKAFLTLLTAVLVASITFSEKIVNLDRSGWWPRSLMIGSWV